MDSFGFRAAVRFHIDAKFALRGLDRHIDFAFRHIKALGDNQEMVDQRIHMLSHVVAVGQHDLWRVGLGRPRLEPIQSLADDLVGLVTFAHTDTEPGPNIAVRLGWNVKIIRLITRIWIMPSEIKLYTAAAKARAGQPP